MTRSTLAVVALVVSSGLLGQPAASAGEKTLGDKVVRFCRKHEGKRVGNGQCAVLAAAALRAAGARIRVAADDPNPGDYVWGKPVYRLEGNGSDFEWDGQLEDVRPGDIIQFRNARCAGSAGHGRYTKSFPHHTAIVIAVDMDAAAISIYHQNVGPQKLVTQDTLRLRDLREGWLRIYRPIPLATADDDSP